MDLCGLSINVVGGDRHALIRKTKMKAALVDSWSIAIAAATGGVLGTMVATAYHLLHDHSRLPSADLLPHFIPQLITGGIGGALMIGWAAVLHDRQRQARRSDPQPRKQA
jgi:hypothetical protein